MHISSGNIIAKPPAAGFDGISACALW